jgi:type IX secretion system PorP/SprF family membrane protein
MSRLYFFLIIMVALAAIDSYAQQDPLYNQYLFNQAIINPGYVGTYNVTNATLLSRSQWTGIKGAPETQTLSLSSSLHNEILGAGFLVISDRLGINKNTEVQASVAYKLKFDKSRLAFGMQLGFVSYNYNYTDLNLEVIDQVINRQMPDFTKPTLGAGIFYRSDKYYVGLSVPRLLDITVEDGVSKSIRYKRHYYLSGGFVIDKFESVKIKPSLLVKIVDGQTVSADLNASVLLANIVWAGASIRNFQTLAFNAQVDISNRFRFGYIYELPSKSLAGSTFGSHEIMLNIDFGLFGSQAPIIHYF